MKIIQENSFSLLQVKREEEFNKISLEQFSKLDNGGHFNTGRITLSTDELKALIKFSEEKGLL